MIKTNKGRIKIKGCPPSVMTDFSMITRSMVEMFEEMTGSRELAIELLDHAYATGKLTKEETKAKADELRAKMAEEGKA